MSSKETARRAEAIIYFNGVDISADANKYLLSFSFTDNEQDKTDDLSIELDDRENIWLGSWLNANKTSRISSGGSGYSVSVGDRVKIKNSAADYNGKFLQSWVYDYSPGFTVVSVGKTNPDRIVIGIGGEITAAVKLENLILCDSGGNEIGNASASETGTGTKAAGATIKASILQRNWNGDGKDRLLECGTFQVDSFSANGPPSKVKLKCTSLSYTSTVRRQKKTKAWEKISLSEIAVQIAKDNGMGSYFSSDYNPFYTRREQVGTSDIVFLQRLCKAAGIALKVTANTIIFFDEAEYEGKAAVRSIIKGKSDVESYSFTDGLNDTAYSSCHVSYTEPNTGTTIEYTYTPTSGDGTGEVLEISEKVSSREEARRLAMKRLREKNRAEFSASFTLSGDASLVAGITVNVSGWGAFDGKYIIETATHSLSRSGYTTQLKLSKVLEGY